MLQPDEARRQRHLANARRVEKKLREAQRRKESAVAKKQAAKVNLG
jgi:predicted ATPase